MQLLLFPNVSFTFRLNDCLIFPHASTHFVWQQSIILFSLMQLFLSCSEVWEGRAGECLWDLEQTWVSGCVRRHDCASTRLSLACFHSIEHYCASTRWFFAGLSASSSTKSVCLLCTCVLSVLLRAKQYIFVMCKFGHVQNSLFCHMHFCRVRNWMLGFHVRAVYLVTCQKHTGLLICTPLLQARLAFVSCTKVHLIMLPACLLSCFRLRQRLRACAFVLPRNMLCRLSVLAAD